MAENQNKGLVAALANVDDVDSDDDHVQKAILFLSPQTQQKVRDIPPEYFEMDQEELEAIAHPTFKDRRLRLALWKELEECFKDPTRPLIVGRVYEGICTRSQWTERLVRNPAKLAFLLRPATNYDKAAAEIVEKGSEKLREALENAKVQFPNGHIDAKGVKVILDIVHHFENRTKGAVKQKIDINSTQQNLNVNVSMKDATPANLDEKLAEVRRKISEAQGARLMHGIPEKVIDVGPIEKVATDTVAGNGVKTSDDSGT